MVSASLCRQLVYMDRMPAWLCGTERKHTNSSISRHHPRKANRRLSAPGLAWWDRRKAHHLKNSPQKGISTPIEQVWENFRIPSRVDCWRHFSSKASCCRLEEETPSNAKTATQTPGNPKNQGHMIPQREQSNFPVTSPNKLPDKELKIIG